MGIKIVIILTILALTYLVYNIVGTYKKHNEEIIKIVQMNEFHIKVLLIGGVYSIMVSVLANIVYGIKEVETVGEMVSVILFAIVLLVSVGVMVYYIIVGMIEVVEEKEERRVKRNKEIIEEYYNKNYEKSEEYGLGRIYYEKYIKEEYRGYKVENGRLKEIEEKERIKMSEEEYIRRNKVQYKLDIPIHEEVLSELKIRKKKRKYKFIYVVIEEKIKEIEEENMLFDLMSELDNKVNFIYYYESSGKKINEKKLENWKDYHELFINIEKEKEKEVVGIIEKIGIKYEKYNRKVEYKLGVDVIEFLSGEYLYKKLNKEKNEYIIIHHAHSYMKMREVGKELREYEVMGNHIINIALTSTFDILYEKIEEGKQRIIENRGIKSEIGSVIYPVMAMGLLGRMVEEGTKIRTSKFNHFRLRKELQYISENDSMNIENKKILKLQKIHDFDRTNKQVIEDISGLTIEQRDNHFYDTYEIMKIQEKIIEENVEIKEEFSIFNPMSKGTIEYKFNKIDEANMNSVMVNNNIQFRYGEEMLHRDNMNSGDKIPNVIFNHVSVIRKQGEHIYLYTCTHSDVIRQYMYVKNLRARMMAEIPNNEFCIGVINDFIAGKSIKVPVEYLINNGRNIGSMDPLFLLREGKRSLVAAYNIGENIKKYEVNKNTIDKITNGADNTYNLIGLDKTIDCSDPNVVREADKIINKMYDYISNIISMP